MDIFDSKKGILTEAKPERDVSSDLAAAEQIIRKLDKPMFIEDLIKHVQKTCALTNDEVFGLIQKVDSELKPKPEEDKPLVEEPVA